MKEDKVSDKAVNHYDDITNTEVKNSTTLDNIGNGIPIKINITSSKSKITNNTIEYTDLVGHAIYSDTGEIKNILITNNDIEATHYGILLNSKSLNSKNMIINNNIIDSFKGDPVAFNNPVPEGESTEESFHNGTVIGNILNTNNGSNSLYSGFGVSVADSHNISILGNIIDYARTEGIHFEGTINNCLALGNILNNCNKNGVSILNLNRTYNNKVEKGEPVIISSNQIEKGDSSNSGNGINLLNDVNGVIENNIITNNIIKGFDNGILSDGIQLCIIDKNVFKNNNIPIKVGVNSRIIGENISNNSDTLIDSDLGNGTIVGKIYSNVKPKKIINSTGTNGRLIGIKGFFFNNFNNFTLLDNQDNYIKIVQSPYIMQGKIYFELFGTSGVDTLIFIADVVYDNSLYKLNNILNKGRNAFKDKEISLVNFEDEMSIKISNIHNLTDSKFKYTVEFDGYYLK